MVILNNTYTSVFTSCSVLDEWGYIHYLLYIIINGEVFVVNTKVYSMNLSFTLVLYKAEVESIKHNNLKCIHS